MSAVKHGQRELAEIWTNAMTRRIAAYADQLVELVEEHYGDRFEFLEVDGWDEIAIQWSGRLTDGRYVDLEATPVFGKRLVRVTLIEPLGADKMMVERWPAVPFGAAWEWREVNDGSVGVVGL